MGNRRQGAGEPNTGDTRDSALDGKVICPNEPLELEPNTRLRISIEKVLPGSEQLVSFLQTIICVRWNSRIS